MITIKTGDLLNADETIIAHQVNCCGEYGGLAAAVFERFPRAYADYGQIIHRIHTAGGKGWALLGHAQLTGQEDSHIICNLFGQFYPGADYRPQELEKALQKLAEVAKDTGYSVALPYKLSCGICGGDWNEVLRIIERTMEGVNCVIYKREGDE